MKNRGEEIGNNQSKKHKAKSRDMRFKRKDDKLPLQSLLYALCFLLFF